MSGVLGKMPDAAKDVVKFFENAERFFTLYSIDEDLKCPILNSLLSDKAKQLLHRIPVATVQTFEGLRTNLLREFKLTQQFHYEQFSNSQRYKSENFTQYATRVEVDFKLYLQSRKVTDGDYDRLRQLMLHDKFSQSIPSNLLDFTALYEIDGWKDVQTLAERLDLYSCDRKVDNTSTHQGSGPHRPKQGGAFGSGNGGKHNQAKPSGSDLDQKTTEGMGGSSKPNPLGYNSRRPSLGDPKL